MDKRSRSGRKRRKGKLGRGAGAFSPKKSLEKDTEKGKGNGDAAWGKERRVSAVARRSQRRAKKKPGRVKIEQGSPLPPKTSAN